MLITNKIKFADSDHWGIFFTSGAMIMYEILLTRIFSVTMWYHFAFMAVSLAMFGLAMGAVLVYKFMGDFSQDQMRRSAVISTFLFSIMVALGITVYVILPIGMILAFMFALVPLVFGGVAITIGLTKLDNEPGRMYAFDLAGAAVGCLLLLVIMSFVDGVGASWWIGFLGLVGSWCWLLKTKIPVFKETVVSGCAILVTMGLLAWVASSNGRPLVPILQVKGGMVGSILWEGWNSFSRVTVEGDKNLTHQPIGWGMSNKYSGQDVTQLWLKIDSGAGTNLTKYSGDLRQVDFLKYDVTNIGYYLRKDSEVMVVGSGGGRDILSALVFGQKSVTGVEINDKILEAVNVNFAEFTGYLDKIQGVEFVNKEARSYLASSGRKFDMIQISLIDTFAATSTGAYALTENGLYTTEAWKLFFDHLNDDGIFMVSRWYYKDVPSEVYRLVDLASKGLKAGRVSDNPANHIMIVWTKVVDQNIKNIDGVATLMVSKRKFDTNEIELIEKVSKDLGFIVMYTPLSTRVDGVMSALLDPKNSGQIYNQLEVNVLAPTDDKPFFFQLAKPDLGDVLGINSDGSADPIGDSSVLVIRLLILVSILSGIFVLLPMMWNRGKKGDFAPLSMNVFFGAIGLGYMLIEISLMQRLMIFLGQPTLSLSVVLFSMLLSSGVGSYVYTVIRNKNTKKTVGLFVGLIIALLVVGGVSGNMVQIWSGESVEVRALLAGVCLFVVGFWMGMPFGIGMSALLEKYNKATSWLWSVNAVFSVVGSVLAVVVALMSGFTNVYVFGVASYLLAFMSWWKFQRR